MTIKTENKAMERKAKYYVRTYDKTSKDAWNQLVGESSKAAKRNALIPVQISDKDYLAVNTNVKGKPGDVVMWVDDNGENHLDKLTSSVRPANVFGKVESVITKL